MADWSWKQAVAKCVLEIVNQTKSLDFTLHDVYAYSGELSTLFPHNKNVRQKIRQILQRLRDHECFVSFLGEGRYSLNVEHEELQAEPALRGQEGIQSPATKRVLRNIRLRDTFLAAEIKRRYHHICQVCRSPLLLTKSVCYAEAHHLRPIGSPHYGPDVPGNIIVLCPNHHVLFDRWVATIDPDTLKLHHLVEGVFPPGATLYLQEWHVLSPKHLRYHHQRFVDSVA